MWSFAVSCLVFCLFNRFTVAEEPGNDGDCYHINTGIMTGIVVGDLLLTILLLLPVYYYIHQKVLKEREKDETRNYVNMIGMHK